MSRSTIALSLLAALVLSPGLRAAPLDKDGCEKLKTERVWLEQAGTRGFMSKGPQWAKANLEPGKLEQVRRLLEVDEQLLFRCRGKPLVNLPKDPDPDPAAREPDSTDDAKVPAVKPAKAPKAQKKDKKDPAKKPALKKAAAPAADPPAKPATVPPPEPKAAVAKPDGKSEAGPAKKTAQKPASAKKTKSRQKAEDGGGAPAGEPGANPFAGPKQ
jgi:hypothetical protein